MTPWTVACQAPLSMGFPRQVDWSGLPFPSSGDLPDLRIETRSPALHADSLPSELQRSPYAVCLYAVFFLSFCIHRSYYKTVEYISMCMYLSLSL